MDSDPDPNTARTEFFQVSENEAQDHWDSGYVPLDAPRRTPTPAGELTLHVPTVMATDTLVPSSTPTPKQNVIQFEDEENDVVNCDTQEPVSDPKADIKKVDIVRDELQTLLIRLHLVGPSQNLKKSEYSHAAVVYINPNQEAFQVYWQIHNGQEDQKGDFSWVLITLSSWEKVLVPEFRIPADQLPEQINRIQVGMFHMGEPDSDCASDELVIEDFG